MNNRAGVSSGAVGSWGRAAGVAGAATTGGGRVNKLPWADSAGAGAGGAPAIGKRLATVSFIWGWTPTAATFPSLSWCGAVGGINRPAMQCGSASQCMWGVRCKVLALRPKPLPRAPSSWSQEHCKALRKLRRFIIHEAARSILKLYSALITAFRTQFRINRSPEGYSSEPERIQSPSANASKSRARPPPTGLHRPMNGDATSAWPPSCAPRSVARPSWSRRSPARHPQPEVK